MTRGLAIAPSVDEDELTMEGERTAPALVCIRLRTFWTGVWSDGLTTENDWIWTAKFPQRWMQINKSFCSPHFWAEAPEGRCPVEYRRYFVRPSGPPGQGPQARAQSLRPGAPSQSSQASRSDKMTNKCTDERMDVRTNRISCVLQDIVPLRPLPCLQSDNLKKKRKAGQGYCWPYIDLGRLFLVLYFFRFIKKLNSN